MSAFRALLAAPVALLLAVSPGLAAGLPTPTGLPAQQPKPVAKPYDVSADAHAQVTAAFAEARRTGKNVLLDFGANWCPDCRMLTAVLALPQVAPWVEDHFVEVRVNVDRFNVNMDIPARYGVKVTAIPAVLIVTPDGKLLNADGARELGNARAMSPQATVDLIAGWNKRAPAQAS